MEDKKPDEKKEPSEMGKHLRALKEKINKFLSQDKPSDVLIIKTHLICEYYLNQILIVKKGCSAGELNKLSFFHKNEKALSEETDMLGKRSYESLKLLNKLRNRVGHELEYILSESDVDSLGFVEGKDYILRKYDFDNLPGLLRDALLSIAINISIVLFHAVSAAKKENNSL